MKTGPTLSRSDKVIDVVIHVDEDGSYVAECASMPGLSARGLTAGEAEDLLLAYIEESEEAIRPSHGVIAVDEDALPEDPEG